MCTGVAVVMAVAAVACASAGGGIGSARNSGDITRLDLDGLSVDDAMEAVSLLRPQWLRGRGGSATVVIDGQRSSREALAQVPIGSVARISFMRASDATIRFGTGFFSGAIVVTQR